MRYFERDQAALARQGVPVSGQIWHHLLFSMILSLSFLSFWSQEACASRPSSPCAPGVTFVPSQMPLVARAFLFCSRVLLASQMALVKSSLISLNEQFCYSSIYFKKRPFLLSISVKGAQEQCLGFCRLPLLLIAIHEIFEDEDRISVMRTELLLADRERSQV